jgi:hypothetical protein
MIKQVHIVGHKPTIWRGCLFLNDSGAKIGSWHQLASEKFILAPNYKDSLWFYPNRITFAANP